MIRAALAGGSQALRAQVTAALDATDVELLVGPGSAGADVLLVAGDDAASAEERCQALAATLPCVLLHAGDAVDPEARAVACGARASAALPPEPARLRRAIHLAAARPSPTTAASPGGRLAAVVSGAGGQGASHVARALALALPGPVALLDLDLAGGVQGRLAGLETSPRDAGIAGEERGEDAFERLAQVLPFGRLLPSPARPDLAWLVRDGVVAGACRAARRAHRFAVADVGRPLGPTVEGVLSADVVLLVLRLDEASLCAARSQLDRLAGLAVPTERLVVVANAVRRRDAVRLHAAAGALGRAIDAAVPEGPAGGAAAAAALRELPALVTDLRGAA